MEHAIQAAHLSWEAHTSRERSAYLLRMLVADRMGVREGEWDSLLYHMILIADEGQAELLFAAWPMECCAAMEAVFNTDESVALINTTAQAGALAAMMSGLGGIGG